MWLLDIICILLSSHDSSKSSKSSNSSNSSNSSESNVEYGILYKKSPTTIWTFTTKNLPYDIENEIHVLKRIDNNSWDFVETTSELDYIRREKDRFCPEQKPQDYQSQTPR